VLQPESLRPRTATELLEQILARDTAPDSATTLQREQQNPAVRLGSAARYLDALHVAAEHLGGPQLIADLDQSADRLLKGLTGEPAWPTLCSRLLLLAAAGADPVAELFAATATRDLASAHDQAAVIDWRIQGVTKVATGGPLPWLPSIPHPIAADPNGDHTCTPDHTWSFNSPTRSAATEQVKRRPGRPSRTLPCRPS
jgi:hypothetical protein